MAKKRAKDLEGQPNKKQLKSPLPNQEDSQDFDIETEDFKELSSDHHFGADVEDWLLQNDYMNSECQSMLYKFNSENQREHIKKYMGEVPSWDEVGTNYGAGRYEIILTVLKDGKRRVFSRKQYLHESYNNRMLSEVRESGQQIVNVGGNNNNALTMMKELFSMIVPLLAIGKQNQPDMSDVMTRNYDMLQKVMQRSLTDNAQFLNDMQRQNMGLTEVMENDEETSGVMGMINTLAPMIEKFLPLIIGKPSPVQAMTIEAVKKTPEFLKLTKDRRNLKHLASFIDQKHGKDATKKLLSRFNLKRPVNREIPKKPANMPIKTT